jgi:hypothetical protein
MGTFKELRGDVPYEFFIAGVAAGTPIEWPLMVAPFNMLVTGVKWCPNAAVTANGTNYATLNFRDRTTAGAGTVIPASRSYIATNSAALTSEAMTLSGTATDLNIAAGDVLTLAIAHTGTGLTIPPGLVQVSLRAR